MKPRNQKVNKWKKAIFSAAIGALCSTVFASVLFLLSGQILYFAIIGLGLGIGFSVGGGLEQEQISEITPRES